MSKTTLNLRQYELHFYYFNYYEMDDFSMENDRATKLYACSIWRNAKSYHIIYICVEESLSLVQPKKGPYSMPFYAM